MDHCVPRLVSVPHDEQARKFRDKCWHAQAEEVVQSSIEALAQLKDWKKADIHSALPYKQTNAHAYIYTKALH